MTQYPGPLKMEYYGCPILRQPCDPVTVFGPELREFTERMTELLREQRGSGLAAPQVGVSRRVVVVSLSSVKEADEVLVLVNPEILFTEGECSMEEECFSLPGLSENVTRPERIKVRFQNLDGEMIRIKVDGRLARIIQHETDHLDGVLFVDQLGAIKRTLLAKRLRDMSKKANG